MITINFAWMYSWKEHPKRDTYLILFGNSEYGWECTKEELKEYWIKAVKASRYRTYGDVTLLYKGCLIRGVHNFEHKLLDKNREYKCVYNKYPYKST